MTIDRRALLATAAAAGLAATSAAATEPLALQTATIADLSAAMASGALTSERLVGLCLARMARFEPTIRAVIATNPEALDIARALDAERRRKGPRSPLHGIPVVLKDNIDTGDMPTTGGSFVLAGSVPPKDAVVVRRLRDAGAVILAKTNLSEFAAADPISSVMGQTYNPYNLDYTAGGSSGGSGAAIAAAYATVALGTDTGGSVRGPSTIDGIVGLKPTKGLLSMAGVIPLALTFDSVGPMARNVYDVAATLGVMAGPDPADPATVASRGHVHKDYTVFLKPDAIRGARLGLIRNFTGNEADHDEAIAHAAEVFRAAGGVVVDVTLPQWLMDLKGPFYTRLRWPEFKPQMEAYLATLKPGYPRTVKDLMDRSLALKAPSREGYVPNPTRWALFKTELDSGDMDAPEYRTIHDDGLPLLRHAMEGVLDEHRLDAFLYLTTSARPPKVKAQSQPPSSAAFGSTSWGTQLASLTGFPDLVVPCGYTHDGLPIGMSLMGRAFSEPRLLALGYAFEQIAKVRRPPPLTPPLPGEAVARA